MNGICCRRLLENVDSIFSEVKDAMLECLEKRSEITSKQVEILTSVLNNFMKLFEVQQDLVFSKLRILDPMSEEIEGVEKGIQMLEKLWKKLDVNIIPKCHLLFDHVIDQVQEYNGIADLVEHAHEAGKTLDHLVA